MSGNTSPLRPGTGSDQALRMISPAAMRPILRGPPDGVGHLPARGSPSPIARRADPSKDARSGALGLSDPQLARPPMHYLPPTALCLDSAEPSFAPTRPAASAFSPLCFSMGAPRPPVSLLGLLEAEEDRAVLAASVPRQPRPQPRRIDFKRTSADAAASSSSARKLNDRLVVEADKGRQGGLASSMSKSLGDLASLPAMSQERWQREVVHQAARREGRTQLIGIGRDHRRAREAVPKNALLIGSAKAAAGSLTRCEDTDEDEPNDVSRRRGRSKRVEESVPLFLVNLRLQLQSSTSGPPSPSGMVDSADGDPADQREPASGSSADITPHESSTDTDNDSCALTASERDSGEEEADLSEVWGDDNGDLLSGPNVQSENDRADIVVGRARPSWKEPALVERPESPHVRNVDDSAPPLRRPTSHGSRDQRRLVTITHDRDAAKRGSRREGHQILVPREDEFKTVGWSYGELSRSVVDNEGELLRNTREMLANNRASYGDKDEDNDDNNDNDEEVDEPDEGGESPDSGSQVGHLDENSNQDEGLSTNSADLEAVVEEILEAIEETSPKPSSDAGSEELVADAKAPQRKKKVKMRGRSKGVLPRKRGQKRKKKRPPRPQWFFLDVLRALTLSE